MGENLNAKCVEKHQSTPSGIRFTGVPPPSTIYKNSKNIDNELGYQPNIEQTLFWLAKIKNQDKDKSRNPPMNEMKTFVLRCLLLISIPKY